MLELIIRDGGLIDAPGRRPYLGLGRTVHRDRETPAPLGWAYWRIWHRRDHVLVPWWLYAVLLVRDRWQRWLFVNVLERLGLWEIPDGGYIIHDGRATLPRWIRHAWWCFCNDRDRRYAPARVISIELLLSGRTVRRMVGDPCALATWSMPPESVLEVTIEP